MDFLKRLAGFLTAPAPAGEAGFFPVVVQCARCGEVLRARLHLANELSLTDDDTYTCRKVLIGAQRCFQSVEVTLTFDRERRLLGRQITGGRFVDD
jgi:hypothetical protein